MSYLVLARKCRPQTFDEIVGQEHVTRALSNAISQGRVHHAFLFCGARGVGKTTAARILAKCLSCENAPTAVPCNVCEACREITAGTSVDVQEIDGASNNSVDDVRTLRESIRYLPVRGKRKVYIIDEVHMLSTGAFNALLKTLEEPPEHALFIFATTEVHKVPATILSRVQRYDFKLVSAPRITAHLAEILQQEGVKADEAALALVAHEAAGSVRDALSLLEQVLALVGTENGLSEQAVADALGVADHALIAGLGKAVLERQPAEALRLLATACERSFDLRQLTHAFVEHLRNLVVARTVTDAGPLIEVSAPELEALQVVSKMAPAGLLEMLFDRFVRIAHEVTLSPMPRYVLEVGLVELCQVEPLEPLGDLVERLERLESRTSLGIAPGAGSGGGGRGARPSAATAAAPPVAAAKPVAASKPVAESKPVATPAPGKFANWAELVQALFERNPARFSVFLHGEQVSFTPKQIVVAFRGSFDMEQAHARVAEALPVIRELTGHNVTFEVREGGGGAPSAIQAEEARAIQGRADRREEALKHPARQVIKETFGEDAVFQDPEVE